MEHVDVASEGLAPMSRGVFVLTFKIEVRHETRWVLREGRFVVSALF